jgi:hypothetical protein
VDYSGEWRLGTEPKTYPCKMCGKLITLSAAFVYCGFCSSCNHVWAAAYDAQRLGYAAWKDAQHEVACRRSGQRHIESRMRPYIMA